MCLHDHDHIELPYDSFVCPAHRSSSWFDHILSSDAGAINQLHILFYCTVIDHIPIKFNFRISDEAIKINEETQY